MRATRDYATELGASSGAGAGASVGGSVGGPGGAYAGGVAGGIGGGYAAGKVYDVASDVFGGGSGGKNEVTLDPIAYQTPHVTELLREADWRGATGSQITDALIEGDRVTSSLPAVIDVDAIWAGLPNVTIRQLQRAFAVRRLIDRLPSRGARPDMPLPRIHRANFAHDAGGPSAPRAPSSSSSSVTPMIGTVVGAVAGAAAGWFATRSTSKRKWRGIASSAGAVAGGVIGYGGTRWLSR